MGLCWLVVALLTCFPTHGLRASSLEMSAHGASKEISAPEVGYGTPRLLHPQMSDRCARCFSPPLVEALRDKIVMAGEYKALQ